MSAAPRRISPARRALFLAAVGALALALALPVALRLQAAFGARARMGHTALHDSLAARGMFAGDIEVLPVPLNQYCTVDERPAYDGYCRREYGDASPGYCNVRFCRFGDVTTTLAGFTGPLDQVALRPKPEGMVRILALGGSTTGSSAWDRIWPGQLEIELSERAAAAGLDTRFQVLNAGLSGSSSEGSRWRYQEHARRFEPDIVILGEEVNDTCLAFGATRAADGRDASALTEAFLAGEASAEELSALSPWFARHVDAFVDWRDALADGEERATLAERRRARSGAVGTPECRRGPTDPPPDTPSIFDDYTDGMRPTLAEYERILAIARADGARLVLSTAPHDFRDWMCPLPYRCPAMLSGHDWYRYLTRVANPAIRDFARAHGLTLVDLERRFDAIDDLEPLFSREWMHPSPRGYREIARAYADALWPELEAEARAAEESRGSQRGTAPR